MYSNFNENGVYNNGSSFLMDIENLEKAISYIEKNKIEQISINNLTEKYLSIDLNFLKNLFFIKKLYISSFNLEIKNFEAIYSLKNLQNLEWFCDIPIDIQKLENITVLSIIYFNNFKLLSNTVKILSINGLDSIDNISGIKNVKDLTLIGYTGSSLGGIQKLKDIQSLTIRDAKKLYDIENIKNCRKINKLVMEYFKKDINLEPLAHCQNIQELYLYSKVLNCYFIKSMKRLNTFLCREILNGDLNPLFDNDNLKEVKLI